MFTLKLDIPPLKHPIHYYDSLLLIGSCFTEHISERLQQAKFNVVSNPNGILFNPLSVAASLESYIDGKQYKKEDLFYLNELWNSWDHHTRFSDIDCDAALAKINASQQEAAAGTRDAGWVIITLGSAFQYYLKDNNRPVANNHRAPAQWFDKRLLPIDEITHALATVIAKLKRINPLAKVLLTISPVRHIRDGVVENNRSKARLIEAVHELCSQFEYAHYFPAYELLIDILRDYRFYDIDFVHPNFLATTYVWEQFVQSCIAPENHKIMGDVGEIMTAYRHRPRFPETVSHKKFKESYANKSAALMDKYPYINLKTENGYFNSL
jgi:hypothetical protein